LEPGLNTTGTGEQEAVVRSGWRVDLAKSESANLLAPSSRFSAVEFYAAAMSSSSSSSSSSASASASSGARGFGARGGDERCRVARKGGREVAPYLGTFTQRRLPFESAGATADDAPVGGEDGRSSQCGGRGGRVGRGGGRGGGPSGVAATRSAFAAVPAADDDYGEGEGMGADGGGGPGSAADLPAAPAEAAKRKRSHEQLAAADGDAEDSDQASSLAARAAWRARCSADARVCGACATRRMAEHQHMHVRKCVRALVRTRACRVCRTLAAP